jgi:uncharacterized protein YgbK (DUF1537 family)
MILGVVADDFTGATDIASMLVAAGLRTVLSIGVPDGAAPAADAVVVALKSRTVPADAAVRESVAAWRWLRAGGARQCYFKYCSTFDSTPAGNIGPVADALLAETGARITVACPALPVNGRTVYRGHLFVGDRLLSESGMRDHPLTPMTDADIVRVLQAQTPGRVALVGHDVVAGGAVAIAARLHALEAEGVRFAVCDTIDTPDLAELAEATADLALVTGGSGLASGLGAAYARRGWLSPDPAAARLDALDGPAAVLSGSCSLATNAQVGRWLDAGRPAFHVDPAALAAGEPVAATALNWARGQDAILVYATAPPDAVRASQQALGTARAGELVESCLADIARGLVANGVRRLVIAGGETSGAVVRALAVSQLRIGPMIAPGVPWTQAEGRPLQLALKSGNFGGIDFFGEALDA